MGGVKVYPAWALIQAGKNDKSKNTLKGEDITVSENSGYKSGDLILESSNNFSCTDDGEDVWRLDKSGETFTIKSNVGAIAHVYVSFKHGTIYGADHIKNDTGSGEWDDFQSSAHANGCWCSNGAKDVYTVKLKQGKNSKWDVTNGYADILWIRVDYVNDGDVSFASLGSNVPFTEDSKNLQFDANYKYIVSNTSGATPSTDANSNTKIPISHSCYFRARQEVDLKIGNSGTVACDHENDTYATYSKYYETHFVQTWNVTTSSTLHTDSYSYATFCHQNIMLVPNGFTAFTYTRSGNKMKPGTSIGGGSYIPANVPVIIRYNKQNTASQTATFTSPDGNTLPTNGKLVSVPANAYNGKSEFLGNASSSPKSNLDTKNYKYYFLMKDSRGGLNFLRYSSNTCPGHACYVCLSASAAAKGFVFEFPDVDGGITGIGGVTAARPAYDPSAPMYNAAGQRVGASYKGIVIQNGRKFIKR